MLFQVFPKLSNLLCLMYSSGFFSNEFSCQMGRDYTGVKTVSLRDVNIFVHDLIKKVS